MPAMRNYNATEIFRIGKPSSDVQTGRLKKISVFSEVKKKTTGV
jgi:hypothetical protein